MSESHTNLGRTKQFGDGVVCDELVSISNRSDQLAPFLFSVKLVVPFLEVQPFFTLPTIMLGKEGLYSKSIS